MDGFIEKAGGHMDAMGMSRVSTANSGVASNANTNNNTTANAFSVNNSNATDRANANIRPQSSENEQAIAREEERKRREAQLENVVSVSSDGDTVQVDPNTEKVASQANEGVVTPKSSDLANYPIKDAIKAADEQMRLDVQSQDKAATDKAQKADAEKVNSFVGFTMSDIERLYQQGRISRTDYEKQMAIRQERLDNAQNRNSENATTAAELEGTLAKAQSDGQSIATAFSDRANENAAASAKDRIDAMAKIQDNTQTQRNATINEGRRQWDYQLQA